MTGKNILLINFFLSLNISDFNLFFYLKLQPPPCRKEGGCTLDINIGEEKMELVSSCFG